jgi:23S rRNA (cytidine2498-2'-O)-methyltransferase
MAASSALPYESPFLFVLCQAGAEAALKAELAAFPERWRPSYSRPGFVTFRQETPQPVAPDLRLGSVFAREFGVSLGVIKTDGADWASAFLAWLQGWAKERAGADPYRIHVVERPSDDEAESLIAPRIRGALAKAGWKFGGRPESAQTGEWVFDWVVIDETESWVGLHRQHAEHSGYPGGELPVDLPSEAPSRAYLKLAEAEMLWEVPLRRGDRALEIGASPGGVSYGLLERGMEVWGVDPGLLAPTVRAYGGSRLHHLRLSVFDLQPEQVKGEVDWVLLDMNTPPDVSLQAFTQVWKTFGGNALGALLVIKLNQWKLAEGIPRWLADLKALGFTRVRARQLPSNRQEFTVYLEAKRGQLRREGKAFR